MSVKSIRGNREKRMKRKNTESRERRMEGGIENIVYKNVCHHNLVGNVILIQHT